jgi:hypothetical protein
MKTLPIFLSVTLAGLTACSVISKGKDTVGGGAKDKLGDEAGDADDSPVGDMPDVPGSKLEADDDDPPHVSRGIERLDKMEVALKAKEWLTYTELSHEMWKLTLKDGNYDDTDKKGAIVDRLLVLDAAAYKAYGGEVYALIGKGKPKRVLKGLPSEASEVANALEDACDQLPDPKSRIDQERLQKTLSEIDAAIEKGKKIDKRVFRSYLEDSPDVANVLIPCDIKRKEVSTVAGDTYVPGPLAGQVPGGIKSKKMCGVSEFSFEAPAIGGGQFGPYLYNLSGYAKKVPCNKLKKKNKFPGYLKGAVQAYRRDNKDPDNEMVFVIDGAPFVSRNDDGELNKYQPMKVYSREFDESVHPCGGDKVMCELYRDDGVHVTFNAMEFALQRAAVHAGKDVAACKKQLGVAKERSEEIAAFRKTDSWDAEMAYLTRYSGKLDNKEFLAAAADRGERAEDRLESGYCKKRQKPDKVVGGDTEDAGDDTAGDDTADDDTADDDTADDDTAEDAPVKKSKKGKGKKKKRND